MRLLLVLFPFLLFFTSCMAQSLPDDIDISTSPNGVVPLPENVSNAWHNGGFVKYTKVTAPNGQAIHFVAQDEITDVQLVRARNILQFYLTDVPGTTYGFDKVAIANQMTINDAILVLLNGADGDAEPPYVPGQQLYADEIAVEGHSWYINNNFEHRDAAFEEILHLVHDTGIGVDGSNSYPGADPAFQQQIRAAQVAAGANDFAIWPIGADGSDPGVQGWYYELNEENSLSQEYLASVVDSYYGLWGPWTETVGGMWGIYIAKTRADIAELDPAGTDIMNAFFAPFININMDIDPTFSGIFQMSFDETESYTHKSQYLQHCTLTGANASGLKGNDEYNRLTGNTANNTLVGQKGNDRLDGSEGVDVAMFSGMNSEYTINNPEQMTIVADLVDDRDGIDTLINMEV
ncbi:MAG: hypothetical protein AAGJ93_00380, partial [Bacteroidota bacterium]